MIKQYDRPAFLDDETNGAGKAKKTNRSARSAAKPSKPSVPPNNGLLAVDIRVMNTGYQSLPLYYTTFIMPYLNGKYGATYGSKVYSIWQPMSLTEWRILCASNSSV
jgi:hypothetical protein